MLSMSSLKQRWWMHRDQKLKYCPVRDKSHINKYPNAFSMEKCFQSSLYITDSINHEDDGFICCPGSHVWNDEVDWDSSPDRHHVHVPYTDQRVIDNVSKLIIYAGEMIIWDSKLAHMGGYINKVRKNSKGLHVKMIRLEPIDSNDFHRIKELLDLNGVCVVKNIASDDDMVNIKEQLRKDISEIYDIPLASEWSKYPKECYGRVNKGGSSWGPIACGKAAWDARILPKRVQIFKSLLDTDDIVVSLDSVHWNIEHQRLSFMASFSPRSIRSDDAYKRKCISQAYGLTRTTHWAHIGDISKFNYGSERNSIPHTRYLSISNNWKGYGSLTNASEEVRNTYVKVLSKKINALADQLTIDEVEKLLDPNIFKWL
jgi:hypothetical protein